MLTFIVPHFIILGKVNNIRLRNKAAVGNSRLIYIHSFSQM